MSPWLHLSGAITQEPLNLMLDFQNFQIFFLLFFHLYLKNRECFWRDWLSGSSNKEKGVVILFWREGIDLLEKIESWKENWVLL